MVEEKRKRLAAACEMLRHGLVKARLDKRLRIERMMRTGAPDIQVQRRFGIRNDLVNWIRDYSSIPKPAEQRERAIEADVVDSTLSIRNLEKKHRTSWKTITKMMKANGVYRVDRGRSGVDRVAEGRRDELKAALLGISSDQEIMKEFGISSGTLYSRAKEFGIRRRVVRRAAMEAKVQALLESGKTITETAAESGVPLPTVYKAARRLRGGTKLKPGPSGHGEEKKKEVLNDVKAGMAQTAAAAKHGVAIGTVYAWTADEKANLPFNKLMAAVKGNEPENSLGT